MLFSEGLYSIEIDIKIKDKENNEVCLPSLEIKKNIEDFQAFHQALTNQIKNLKFPNIPKLPSVNIKPFIDQKFHNQRIEIIQKIFDLCLFYSQQYPDLREMIFYILYKFLIKDARFKEDSDEVLKSKNKSGKKEKPKVPKYEEHDHLQSRH